ncbi:hypothetical protein KC909_06495 [Candidatus Dojkabacteria bacterium]|uniref:Uncharacterized protein n=1 Tax=Candidatus Dojkabacteria bacterium TaxID=2099670 RepID=A0A955RJN6_9BACT|nr:hypothetical protein [Candidatus Dojkabacteria bacterium]
MSEYFKKPRRTAFKHRNPATIRRARGFNGELPETNDWDGNEVDENRFAEPEPISFTDMWFTYLLLRKAGYEVNSPRLPLATHEMEAICQDGRMILDRNFEPILPSQIGTVPGYESHHSYLFPEGGYEIHGSPDGVFRNTASGNKTRRHLPDSYWE